jgi:tetratricopeptide (TPR) repeat protein
MSTSSRVEELKQKFDENPRRYFAPLANELRKLGDLAQAIAICRAHLPTQPGHVSGHIVLAQALYEAGETEDARAEFAAAVELDPENLIALRYMGDIARATGDIAEATGWYQRVLDADPRNYEITRVLRELESLPNDPEPVEREELPAEAASESADPEPSPGAGASAAQLTELEEAPDPSDLSLVTQREQHWGTTRSDAGHAATGRPRIPTPEPFSPETDDSFFTSGESDDFASELAATSSEKAADGEAEEPTVDPSELDALWGKEAPAASQLSDYEAAPEQWFDGAESESTDEDQVSGPAAAGDRRDPTPTAEIEALFDASEVTAHVAQHQAAEAPVRAEPVQDEVDAAFRGRSAAPPHESVSESDSIDEGSFTQEVRAAFDELAPASDNTNAPDHTAAHAETARDPVVSEPPPVEPAHEEPPQAPDPHVGRTPSFTATVPERPAPFVTETLAELYVQQGFMAEALSIYRQLLWRNPNDETIRSRIASLEGGHVPAAPTPKPVAQPTANQKAAQSVRTFFGRLAHRAPGGRPASVPEPTHDDEQGGGVFAGASSDADTRAALNLSSAFSRDASAGEARPTRPAERDLSLDHLFREGPPPDAGPVTIDEFYAPPESVPAAPANGQAADEDRAADIKQFTSWLEGLKKK